MSRLLAEVLLIGTPSSSAVSTVFASPSATSDLGVRPHAEATFHGLFADTPFHVKNWDEVRLDLRSNATSNISVGCSLNNGVSYSFETSLRISAHSNVSQYIVYPKIGGGVYGALRIRSSQTDLYGISAVYVKATLAGEIR